MKNKTASRKVRNDFSRLSRNAVSALCERMEERRLMSVSFAVRAADGSTSAPVTSVGQVLHLQLLAIVTDPNNTPSQSGFYDVVGSIISTASQGHPVTGSLAASNVTPFASLGSSPGAQQDLNGDGNIDVGSLVSSGNGFTAFSAKLEPASAGTIVGNTCQFLIGNITYTVTSLNKGGATDIAFLPTTDTVEGTYSNWEEDGMARNSLLVANGGNGTIGTVAPFVVSDPALIVPPIAVNDSATASIGTATTINVLTNDDVIVALNPASVIFTSGVSHGTTVLQSDGSVLYTPTAGYVGTDSFSYHVADTDGRISNIATVSIDVVNLPPPVATSVSASVLTGQANTINVLSNVTSSGPALVPASVTVSTAPANGSTSIDTTDGSIVYTPNAGFIGSDTFQYTVTDANAGVSNAATVTINVGATVSNVAGSAHSISFKDAAGGIETIALSSGSAQIFFSGTGALVVAKNQKGTITGSGLNVTNITLTGTSRTSSLSIKGSTRTPLTIGSISDASPLGSIIAPAVTLNGSTASALNGVGVLNVGDITNATLTVGSGLPTLSFSAGNVTSSSLTSAVPITTLKAKAWTGGLALSAPAIKSLQTTGNFNAALNLSTGSAVALASARIGGALDGSITSTAGLGAISATTVASTWTANVGNLTSFKIKTGGLASTMITGNIGTLSIGGNYSGILNANALQTLTISGAFTGGMAVATTLGKVTATSMTNGTLTAGVTAFSYTPLTPLFASTTSSIGSVKLTGHGGNQFTNSVIIAPKITTLSIGSVATDNSAQSARASGEGFGIAANSLGSFTGTFANKPLKLSAAQLTSQSVLNAYVSQKAITFGDFQIEFATS